MNYLTLFCILCAFFLLNFDNYCPECITPHSDTVLLSQEETSLRDDLRAALRRDGLAGQHEMVKIEFEFHDLFINERIPGLELMVAYQTLLREYGVEAGPQRQILLFPNGYLAIGDYDDWGQLLGNPVRLGIAIAIAE